MVSQFDKYFTLAYLNLKFCKPEDVPVDRTEMVQLICQSVASHFTRTELRYLTGQPGGNRDKYHAWLVEHLGARFDELTSKQALEKLISI